MANNFNPKSVTPIEWAGIGAGALAFIASFLPWYSYSWKTPVPGLGTGGSASAWSVGILGWGAVLLLVAAAVIVLLPHVGTQVNNRPVIWLALAGVAVLFVIIRWLTLSSSSDFGILGDSEFSAGAGFGLFVGLLAAVGSAVAAFLTFQAAQKGRPAGPVAGPGTPPPPPGY